MVHRMSAMRNLDKVCVIIIIIFIIRYCLGPLNRGFHRTGKIRWIFFTVAIFLSLLQSSSLICLEQTPARDEGKTKLARNRKYKTNNNRHRGFHFPCTCRFECFSIDFGTCVGRSCFLLWMLCKCHLTQAFLTVCIHVLEMYILLWLLFYMSGMFDSPCMGAHVGARYILNFFEHMLHLWYYLLCFSMWYCCVSRYAKLFLHFLHLHVFLCCWFHINFILV